MIDLVWKLFSQTGNIETYLLMKELESEPQETEPNQSSTNNLENLPVDSNL
ncbi:YqzL family protein [Ornithinibacillus scapharcae]|uniref:YqzL family protein n=1 Tax=Ornithinibacillus scapharcae TaxID=1147159 RepID=UPI000225B3A1|nr:YqzL family protein [Ornithinibacillus scapharcae]